MKKEKKEREREREREREKMSKKFQMSKSECIRQNCTEIISV